jgi:hypothetical protein
MQNSILLKLILVMAGLIGAIVGAGMLFAPVPFHSSTGIELGDNISLLNEMRTAGGALLAGGLFILAGAFFAKITFSAAIMATLLYLAYGFSRVYSIAVDGAPDEAVYLVMTLEIFVGLICVWALARFREQPQ